MVIGLYLRHIKAYEGINFIPIGYKLDFNFISYIGKNGIGKSSILEGFDSFFNEKIYNINKNATSGERNKPFFVPIFLIRKSDCIFPANCIKDIDKLNDFFWNIKSLSGSADIKGFKNIRDDLLKQGITKEEYYLLMIGEEFISNSSPKISFGTFTIAQEFLSKILDNKNINITTSISTEEIQEHKSELAKKYNKILQIIKDHYSYIYFPVELNIENFTKIETTEMQKVFGKKLKKEIESMLSGIKLDGTNGINPRLDNFIKEIQNSLRNNYEYKTGQQRNNKITKNDIVNKIIEVYFQKRILYKNNKKISELSAGEKRQALIDIISAFLIKTDRDSATIIAIDEPENSLHTSVCYEQFDRLNKVSKNCQVFITTHWYGFLPILNEGFGHFLTEKETKTKTEKETKNKKEILFETYDLYDYKARVKNDMQKSKNEIPHDFNLKSINDLVQAIYYSLYCEKPYNWLLVEGVSEKIYFEYFFKDEVKNNLRILPLGGNTKVSEIYEHLELPLKKEDDKLRGKVFCLIDTDKIRHKEYIKDGNKHLKIRRLCNIGNDETRLYTLENSDTTQTDIEQSLNPIIFKETMEKLDKSNKYQINIQKNNGNTSFIDNLKSIDLKNYFEENEGSNKIKFAEKYVEISKEKENNEKFIPNWILEIKDFYKK